MMNSGAGRAAQAVADAVADARTLVIVAQPRFGSALWAAQRDGSRAFVACLDGAEPLAVACAIAAAHAAFRAVPGLRG